MAAANDPTDSLFPGQATASLADQDQTKSGADAAATAGSPPITNPTPASGDRYELGEEIARGGMGVIYRATDTAFGREVAVKVLQQKFGGASSAARRFADEARITGQLQHPSIPPVYDLGALPDGRPFLAMRLVKGRTLDELLKERGPGSPNLVAVFEQVCQAVGYAHARGVVHRDLTPSNVMVGAFGEVQVMDWGLAKVLGATAGSDEPAAGDKTTTAGTAIDSDRDDSDATRAGSVLGTPAYMPPEQAIGAVDQVESRSDVFGLGAILCAILTGKPPFLGADSESTRQLAARAKLDDAFARLGGCGAEGELVALCKQCLSAEKAARPANAGEVARAVAGLRTASEERARRAQLDRVRAEAESRELRKRRRVQLALTAAVGLLLAFTWYSDRQATQQRIEANRRDSDEQTRLARNAEAVAELVSGSEAALREGDVERAAAALKQVDRRLPDGGGDAVRDRAVRCQADLTLLRELDAIDTLRWTPVGNAPAVERVRSARLPAALARHGIAPGEIPTEETVVRVNGSLVRERLLTAFDIWLAFAPSASVREVLRGSDPDPYRDAVRDATARRDRERLIELAGRSEALAQPARFAAVLGQHWAVPVKRRRQVLEAALRSRPGDLALLMALGESYPFNRREGADERVRWFQAAVAAHPRNVTAHINLGDALNLKGDLDGAAGTCREVIRLDPKFAPGHNNLGLVLRARGDLDGALACFREAARLDPKEPKVHYNLASTLRNQGDLSGSIRSYSEALRLVLAQSKEDSSRRTKGGVGGAVASLEEIVRLDPDDANAHNDLAWALATGPDGVRDGQRAVEHATRACELTVWKEPSYIDTLGAAHAEAGDFVKAVEYQIKALSFPPFEAANGKGGRMRLELYAQKRPYRDPAQATRESAPPPRNGK